MKITFINCELYIEWIGTEEDLAIREWCYNRQLKNKVPIKKPKPTYSKSPNKDLLEGGYRTSVRYCKTCKKTTVFRHRYGWKHSHCTECDQTFSSRGILYTKINKCLHPKRYLPK